MLRVRIPHADCPLKRRLYSLEIEVVEYISVSLMIWPMAVVGVKDCVPQSACSPDYRHCPVFERYHLGQPAGLEQAGDNYHIGPGIYEVRELLVKSDLDVAVRVVIQLVLEMEKMIVDTVVRAGTKKDELASV